jgi:Ca-activated chloride channel family protein
VNRFHGIDWQNPWVFWLLLLLPLFVWIGWKSRARAPRMFHPGFPRGFHPRAGIRRRISSLPLWLRLLALACLLVGLARPVIRTPWSEDSVNGVDIVLMLDVSTSMQIRDVSPNRIEAARRIMADFIAGRDRDRMGLVAFAGHPVTRCPLTTDREVLRDLLDSTSNQDMDDGTAIGDALMMAGNRLRKSMTKSKVVVLLTDGQNNMGAMDPLAAARVLATEGIRVYTIGLGTEGVFEQEFKLPDGQVVRGKVQSDMDTRTLSAIAATTGGKFWRALDRGALQKAYAEIDRLERTRISTRTQWEVHERFRVWAFAALVLSLLAWTLEATVLRRVP